MATRKKSDRTTISESERLQLIGLVAMAHRHQTSLREVEAAMLSIVQEVESDGTRCEPWQSNYTSDAVNSLGEDPVVLINKLLGQLELTVDHAAPEPDPALELVQRIAAAGDPMKGGAADHLQLMAVFIRQAKEITIDPNDGGRE